MRFIFLLGILSALNLVADPVRVVVWDEQQAEQKQAYPNFLGNQIAAHLRTFPTFTVRSVSLADPEQGLSDEILDHCDVLIWWGHQKHAAVSVSKAKQIVQRIKDGRLSLIALHSAHWSEPFVQAMNERARDDAQRTIPAGTKIEFVTPERRAPKPDAPLTPRTEMTNAPDGSALARVFLPLCVFPSWRADGAPSHVTTVMPGHPIARAIPSHFNISHTEMYNEPFHVPAPDAVIFEEKWDKGEHFRSGCVWNLGKGKIFYFRPGHETYPVYIEGIPLKIVSNAVWWLGNSR